jgi:hypothetical protein
LPGRRWVTGAVPVPAFLLAIVLIGVVAGTPAAAAPAVPAGSLGLRLVDVPTTGRTDPRASIYIVDAMPPGSIIHRRIEVSNGSAAATRVLLYAAAATITRGAFLGADGRTVNELSSWTSVQPGQSMVPAGGTATPTVTIAVPRDAAPGEQYGVVWAEVRSAASGGLTQVSRVGIRLYILVGPGGAAAADFGIDSMTAGRSDAGLPTVRAAVHNTGGRALDMAGTLTLRGGPGGLTAGPFPVTVGTTVGIGGTTPVGIALSDQLPAGPWDARLVLRSGLVERTARATITFPAAGTAAPVPTTAGRSGWLYAAVAAIVLLAITGVVVLVRRRRTVRVDAGAGA